MGRAGHRIFRDSALRREEPRDEIAILARCGNDNAPDRQLGEAIEFRTQPDDLLGSREDGEVIVAFENLPRLRA